ncbi:Hypothetical predicted protein [Cloeon dipterum]|uniref:Uncharacterized protein n=1 Tax=Cloeon dipterum TaxID=197152 RepID=A0A8S1C079_9INSE|nr:Hypothetical predicted protein [Cloeon dipterum]
MRDTRAAVLRSLLGSVSPYLFYGGDFGPIIQHQFIHKHKMSSANGPNIGPCSDLFAVLLETRFRPRCDNIECCSTGHGKRRSTIKG